MEVVMPGSMILTDADGLANNTTPAVLVLQISRREIESGNVSSALERLMVMADTREATLLYRESLLFHVTGYDGDLRELPEIPDIRVFFTRLTREFPHWLWFLHRGVGAISLLLALLCKVRIHRTTSAYGTEFLDQDEMGACLHDLFQRGNALFEAFGIPEDAIEESANSAIADFLRT